MNSDMLKVFQIHRNKLPHFLVLGVQKGGTTSLQRLLEQHQDVYLPKCKEVHYFTQHSHEARSWYASHYTKAKKGQKRGDITPFYIFHPEAPRRIHNLLPRVKMIILLRDPVERTLSQYFHARRNGFEQLELPEALQAEEYRLRNGGAYSLQKHSYKARSYYIEQLDRYEKLFKKNQIMVLKSETLFAEPKIIWGKIQEFINLKTQSLPKNIYKYNSGEDEAKTVDESIRTKLREEFKETVLAVRERYGIDWGWA
ncbi:sulfotransferase domain-containing protein [Synechococcus sp. GEYO]|uniref:sulfotransferase domain-containing protein n=1 Tax=Synechococcus sp. GEYO TaxID=2575511 RepID=UPI000E0E82C6|nr:sulfotransferase domain-containing protein [Synechococcus sp. GEYO]